MNAEQVIRFIDRGANFYIDLFARAAHMERIDCGCYTMVLPKPGEEGIRFVYNLRLEGLPEDVQWAKIAEIRKLRMPVWLDLCSSDAVHRMLFGRERVRGRQALSQEDEVYMAMLPEETAALKQEADAGVQVHRVETPEEFAQWTQVANAVLAGGRRDLHPVEHYFLCKEQDLKCYYAMVDGKIASVAAIADDDGIDSLEFVATAAASRRLGLARAVCRRAVKEAFTEGARIVTVRAIDGIAAQLYGSMGFVAYNDML